jgi:hypothetical protein
MSCGTTVNDPLREILQRSDLVASLIGRLGSSDFRLSTRTVSRSLAGSCFSSESAPRPFHHGIRRRGGTIYWAALCGTNAIEERNYFRFKFLRP